MSTLRLKIITPQKIALEDEVISVTAPAERGEVTILPNHSNMFMLLKEGLVKIRFSSKNSDEQNEKYLAIGGGYLETDGDAINILVSRAYGQDEIDAEKTQKAIDEAKKIIAQTKDDSQRREAITMLRRSVINLKLLKRRKRN